MRKRRNNNITAKKRVWNKILCWKMHGCNALNNTFEIKIKEKWPNSKNEFLNLQKNGTSLKNLKMAMYMLKADKFVTQNYFLRARFYGTLSKKGFQISHDANIILCQLWYIKVSSICVYLYKKISKAIMKFSDVYIISQ